MEIIKAITFDVGGTLIEPWPSVGHAYAGVAARYAGGTCRATCFGARNTFGRLSTTLGPLQLTLLGELLLCLTELNSY